MDIYKSIPKPRLYLFLYKVELAQDLVRNYRMRGRELGINITINIAKKVSKLRALDKTKWEVVGCKELDI